MSELQRQLALARQGPAKADDKRALGKVKVASFMFEDRTAAELSIDDCFALGTEGLTELSEYDSRFLDYLGDLFSQAGKDTNRELQTKEVNAKLDQIIDDFFLLLGPYFLLKPAHKVIEYMVRRYKVHEYNVDSVMRCILPYHETLLFSRFVQLLRIAGTKWEFLAPIQTSGAPLFRDILVRRSRVDFSVMEFVCEMTKMAIATKKSSKTIVSFFGVVLMEFIGAEATGSAAITEDTLKRIFPYILNSIKNQDEKDYQLAGYMALTQVFSRFELSDDFLSTCIDRIVRNIVGEHKKSIKLSSDAIKEALMCLVFLFQSQRLDEFPPSAFHELLSSSELASTILSTMQALAQRYDVYNFMSLFLQSLVAMSVEKPSATFGLLETALKEMPELVERHVKNISSQLLDLYIEVSHAKSKESEKASANINRILKVIDGRYPVELDKGVNERVKTLEDEGEKELILNFVQLTFAGTGHLIMKETQTSLFLSCEHPDPNIRLLAIKHLKKQLADGTATADTRRFAAATFLRHLLDEDPVVVSEVLSCPNLLSVLLFDSSSGAVDALFGKLASLHTQAKQKSSNESYATIRKQILELFAGQFLDAYPHLLEKIVPFVLDYLMLDPKLRELNQKVLTIASNVNYPLFSNIAPAKTAPHSSNTLSADEVQHNIQTIDAVARNLVADIEHLLPVCTSVLADGQHAQIFLVCVLNRALALLGSAKDGTQNQVKIASALFSFIREDVVNIPSSVTRARVAKALSDKSNAETTGLPSSAILSTISDSAESYSVLVLFTLLNILEALPTDAASSTNDEVNSLLQEIFIDIAMCNHPASLDLFQAHLGSLFKRHLKKKTLKFLSHFWTKEVMAVPTLVQVRALTLASLVISASKKPTDLQLIVPSLFIPLSSPIKSVRKVALDFVSVVAKVLPEEASTPAPHGFYPEVSDKSKSFSLAIPTNKLKSLLQRLTKETGQIMANATFLQSFLSKESSDKKIVHYLSSHVHAFDTIYPKLAMLHLLQDADDSHKLEVLHPLLNSLLDKSKKILEETQTSARISKEEKDLIGALLSLFTEESLRLLNERNSHEYFDTFLRALSFHQSVPYHNGDEDTQTKAAEPIPMNVDDSEEEEEEDNGDSTSSSTKRTALTGASTKRFVPALCVVSLVTPSFFQGLSVPLRHKLFASICDVLGHAHRRQGVHAGQTDSDIVTIKFKQVVKNLPLNAETILAGLPSALLPATSPDTAASTPKKRKDAAPVVQIDEAAVREAMHKLSTLLEVLQVAESAVADSHLLVKPLFNVLRAVTSQPFSIDSLAEYNLNLLIGILTDISDVSEPNNIEKLQSQSQHFDVDAVVGFLKESESAQTRNNALLLLGNMTRLFPKRCLAQIVPALTFMSQTLRRSDDSYTFSVIQKTLEMVVPKAAENGVSIKDIVHSFTTCVEYISIQFNVQLFCSLVSALSGSDVGQHLPSVIALLLEKYAKSGNKIEIPLTTEAADEEEESHVIPMICEALFKPFSATVRLSAMLQLLITVNKLLSQGEARASASMVFDSKDANKDQIRLFSTSVLALLIKHISSKEFIERVVDEPKDNKPVLEKLLGSFVETILVLTVDQAQLNRSSKAKQFLNETKGALYLLFEKINGLLSVGPFLKIIADLLTHKNIQVRIKAFELFNNRLTRESINIEKFEAQFLAMIPDIVRVIKSQSQDAEHALLKQSSIESMAVLTKKLGAKYPDQIAVVLPDLVPCLESAESTAEVMASSAICLATICAAIGVKSLGYLPKICPRLVAIVKESLLEENNDSKDCNQLLQLSILSSLEVFVIKMHKFMSPYLADITAMLLHKGLVESENAKVVEKTTALLRLLAMKIEARHLLEPLFAAYNSALLFGDKSLCLLFNTFGIAISAMDMETINAHYKRLFKFYLEQAIEIRHLHSSKVTDIEDVEKHMISSFMDLVLKLSENVFKPFFLKMVEWAYAAAADEEDSVVSHLNKSITFYHLVSATVKKLKSIFVPYFAYILQHCGTELKRLNRRGDSDDAEEDDSGDGVVKMVASASKNKNSNSKKSKSKSKRKHSNISSAVEEDTITKMKQQQICLILSCLSGCFKHDADGFMTDKSNNDAIVQPLVDLLSNTSVGGASAYQERVERYLIPCLINLIAAVGNDALWRPITYEVLQKTHSPNPVVRYSAAKTLLGFYEKMGEDFLVMLPETLPHLAELMEDDDARVEQITQELVKRIEALSGESVTQLLK